VIDLSWCGAYSALSSPVLASFIRNCAALTHLRMANVHSVDQSVLAVIASRSSSTLVELSLANCVQLASSDFTPLASVNKWPALRSLNLARTAIRQRDLSAILRVSPELLHLRLSSCSEVNGDATCQQLASTNVKLISLELWRVTTLTGEGATKCAQLTSLRDLDIGWCSQVDANDGCLVQVFETCTRLSRLVLAALRTLSDRDLTAVANLSELRQLEVVGADRVTYEGIRLVLARCPLLVFLDLGYCQQLPSAAVFRLRREFPRCHILNSHPQHYSPPAEQ